MPGALQYTLHGIAFKDHPKTSVNAKYSSPGAHRCLPTFQTLHWLSLLVQFKVLVLSCWCRVILGLHVSIGVGPTTSAPFILGQTTACPSFSGAGGLINPEVLFLCNQASVMEQPGQGTEGIGIAGMLFITVGQNKLKTCDGFSYQTQSRWDCFEFLSYHFYFLRNESTFLP